jgi:hypothetical protein
LCLRVSHKPLLAGVSGRVSWATNSGRSGVISLRRLHRRLIRPGKPAIGTLHIAGQRGGNELAFRLSRPRYNAARHTVAYRAKPLRGHRAARAAGFRRPGRFGAASLSVIPHPTLMGTSPQGGPTCSVKINNQSDRELTAADSDFQLIGTWHPAPPSTIPSPLEHGRTQAAWAAVGTVGGRCLNAGTYTMAGIGKVTFSIDSADPSRASCDAPESYICVQMSQSGNEVVWQLVGPR